MLDGHIPLYRNVNETIKNVFLLYNGISEQYHDLVILEKIRSLIPEQILQLYEDDKIKPLLEWFAERSTLYKMHCGRVRQGSNAGTGNDWNVMEIAHN